VSRSPFGWDLPPGVSMDSIERAYGGDGDECAPLNCGHCGGFLKRDAEATREWDVILLCDGKPSRIEQTHDDAVLAIIGEEHRGETFTICYPAACGSRDGKPGDYSDGGEEISEADLDAHTHAPHWFRDAWGQQQVALRTCARCGTVNEETLT
jgi:hypothetical protein